MTISCSTKYSAGSITGLYFHPSDMGQHSLHFNVTWDITCADTGCASGEGTYDVLAKALDCDINSVLDTLEGLLDDGALTAITPTRQICKCVGEDEELDACGALCEWEAAGRAAAFNNDNNKKLNA
mgnify:CR=1 FL=1